MACGRSFRFRGQHQGQVEQRVASTCPLRSDNETARAKSVVARSRCPSRATRARVPRWRARRPARSAARVRSSGALRARSRPRRKLAPPAGCCRACRARQRSSLPDVRRRPARLHYRPATSAQRSGARGATRDRVRALRRVQRAAALHDRGLALRAAAPQERGQRRVVLEPGSFSQGLRAPSKIAHAPQQFRAGDAGAGAGSSPPPCRAQPPRAPALADRSRPPGAPAPVSRGVLQRE